MKLKQVFEISKDKLYAYAKKGHTDYVKRSDDLALARDRGGWDKVRSPGYQKALKKRNLRGKYLDKAHDKLTESKAKVRFTKPLFVDGGWHYQSVSYNSKGKKLLKSHGSFKTKKEADSHRQVNKWLGTRYKK